MIHAFISIRYEVLISPPSSKCGSLERKLRLISRRLSCAFLHAAARCTARSLHLPSPLARISLSFVLMTEEEGDSGTMYPHFVRPRPEAVFPAIC